jgi:hypothetical protein
MYILFALALVIGLAGFAAMPKVSADSGTPGVDGAAKWLKMSTPSTTGSVILPATDIIDIAVGSDGMTIYAVTNRTSTDASSKLWKSTDGGWTWVDKTAKVTSGVAGMDNFYLVSVAPDDVNFVTVANATEVAGSINGATTNFATTDFTGTCILDMDVAEMVGTSRHILVGTSSNNTEVWLLKAGAFFGGTWADITNDDPTVGDYANFGTTIDSVTSVAFSPNYATDDGIVIIGANTTLGGTSNATYLQRGRIGTTKLWENEITIVDVRPLNTGDCPLLAYDGSATGIALRQA